MSQPEARLSADIMALIRARGGWCYKVHGGPQQMAGVPDVSAVYRGCSVWVETKMPGNKPSEVQELRHEQIRAAGGYVVVAYSVEDVSHLLDWISRGRP